ncbi:lipopolysaccharide heptosyltransferase I [Neochlamydia sp. EPS4]|uniref:lipopolysaccharide heptosyltransferase I n=1 Tax=Neochlamydia sp. EPS4 TaxID=1478175 RepID=UPI0005D121A1|nr:lipopolysaccharide heptosyltransferase I [Neochlamydia sp. EPS4]
MRILIVKTSSLGDIIHGFPVLAFLHQQFPKIKVDWVVEKSFAEIVKSHPLVERVIEIDTKSWRKRPFSLKTWSSILSFRSALQQQEYAAVIDLQGNTKSAIPTFLARSAHKVGFGAKSLHEWPNRWVTHHHFDPPKEINVRDENVYLVQHYFQCYSPLKEEKLILNLSKEQKGVFDLLWNKIKELPGQKILVCAGSAWRNKRLSYEALESFLYEISSNLKVSLILVWGNAEELAIAQKLQAALVTNVSLLDKVSLAVLQNLMSRIDAVIAMDSLPLHLAGMSGTPSFSVFGASSARKYKPKGSLHEAIQGECPYGRTFERRCPVLRSCPTGLCIRGLSGKYLFQQFAHFYSQLKN